MLRNHCSRGPARSLPVLAALLLALGTLSAQSATDFGDRQRIRINLDWRFTEGDLNPAPVAPDYDDSGWERVAVPHAPELITLDTDSTSDPRPQLEYLRTVSWYRKRQPIPNAPGMRFELEFGAVHQVTDLWVNGRHVGQHAVGGYTPFHFDITDYVTPGQTAVIAVRADNTPNQHTPPDPHDTDYIKFGGIYRDVYLGVTNPLHVTHNYEAPAAGVHITTPRVRKHDASVVVRTTLRNDHPTAREARIVTRLIDAAGTVLRRLEDTARLEPGREHTFCQSTSLTDDIHLWSPDDPYLYRVHSTIHTDGRAVDQVENPLGLRWFELVDGKKFVLNGEPLWLVGVNRHQNFALIGDAVPPALHYRELQQYRAAGMNCVRLSHYTQDESILRACDELGLLVYEEPPTWISWGGEAWWANLETALRTTIRAHRNHPSIIIWGTAINHRGDVPRLVRAALEEDPDRLTASGSSNGWSGRPNAGLSDLYATMDYRNAILPDGDWALSMEHRNNHDAESNQLVISRYRKTARTIGALAWVGADYNHNIITEDRISYRSRSGLLDLFRRPRPVLEWYRSEYGRGDMVHIGDERASYDGRIRVFTNGQEVELFVNGQSRGRRRPTRGEDKSELAHPTVYFDHDWRPGDRLRAVAYRDGRQIATHERTKAGTPARLELAFEPAPEPMQAGGSDLRIAHARITDAAGNLAPEADQPITFSVTGAGTLVDEPSKDIHPVRPEFGQGSMYVRGGAQPGTITVTASAPGLAPATATITTVPYERDALRAGKRAFREYASARVDLGGTGQRTELGWAPWTEGDRYALTDFGGATVRLDGRGLAWHGDNASMFGNLAFVGADGVSSPAGEITLTFTDLPAGEYELVTYHHARAGEGPLISRVDYTVTDGAGTREQRGGEKPMGIHDRMRIGEQEPTNGRVLLTVGPEGSARVAIRGGEGELWLNGLRIEER